MQFCWSHITDDSKKLSENFGKEAMFVHRKLKEVYAIAKSLEHNLYYRDINSLFVFATEPDVDGTNNISERELRELGYSKGYDSWIWLTERRACNGNAYINYSNAQIKQEKCASRIATNH